MINLLGYERRRHMYFDEVKKNFGAGGYQAIF